MSESREVSLAERFEEVMLRIDHLKRGALILRDRQGEHDVELYFAEELAEQVCRIQKELRVISDAMGESLLS